MNKNLFRGVKRILGNKSFSTFLLNQFTFKGSFCSSNDEKISRRFTYGQGGEFTFNLTKRTYSMSFETIWEDYAQLEYSGLSGQQSFFLTEIGKDVKMDDIDLQTKEKEYVKINSKIPEDYTIRGIINGSIHHIKNSVSSKTRSNPFQIQLIGYKNTYQWLNLECQEVKITNKNGEVNIGSLTTKNAIISCEDFKSKKVLFSGQFYLKSSHKAQIRSIVAYQDSQTKIEDSNDVYIESLSGKVKTKNVKQIKIDRLLSCKDGIEIQCDKIHDHIVVESGTGTIQCLKEPRQVLKEKIRLGRMNKGKLDFDIYDNPNSPYSKVLVTL